MRYIFKNMGISVEDFLNRYFGVEELKKPLEDISFPVGGTKNERVTRIVENWNAYNRDWYDLLDYLEWDTLSLICEDFNISYSEYNKEETLCRKIEDVRVLDFRNKTMKSSQKKSNAQPSTVNISGENINIGSNNKISRTSESKNSSISKAQLIVAIIVGTFVIFGVVFGFTLTSDSTKNEFSPTEGFTVETDVGPVPLPQDIKGTEESKIYPVGDTIVDNTLISNSHGFVISVPNDDWKIIYEPEDDSEIFAKSPAEIYNEKGSGNISISKTENIPKDFEVVYKENIRNAIGSIGTNLKEYYVESKDSTVFTYKSEDCTDNDCKNYYGVIILKVVDSDMYHILASVDIQENDYSFIMSPDMYEILNSFKII